MRLSQFSYPANRKQFGRCIRLTTCFFAFFSFLVLSSASRAAEGDTDLVEAEATLKKANIATDGPALLEYFRKRTVSEADRARLARTIRLLGDDSFEVREKATQDLIGAGQAALPLLKSATNDPDIEIAHRIRSCLEGIDAEANRPAAAARLLAARRPAGSVQVLLGYLPSAHDECIQEQIVAALCQLGTQNGKTDPALTAALADKDSTRRWTAALVLVQCGDKSVVPVLVKSLKEGPMEHAVRAEDLLYRIAGEAASLPGLEAGTPEARRKSRDAWEAWWKANEAKVDLAKLKRDGMSLGLTVICDINGGKNRSGRVWACTTNGTSRWAIEDVQLPQDAHLLPGGRILIAEHNGSRVTERDRQGKIIWEKRVDGSPKACQRLPNGNTFIATTSKLLEVTRDGKTVYSFPTPSGMNDAVKTSKGHIVYACNGVLVELDAKGKEVRNLSTGGPSELVYSVEVLPNGHYLFPLYSAGKIMEMDSAGKIQRTSQVEGPLRATRLHSGRTLVSFGNKGMVIEFDRQGKEVWKQTAKGSWPVRARRY